MKSKLIHYNYDKPQYHWIKNKLRQEKELSMTYGEYKHDEYNNVKYFKALPTDPNETYYMNSQEDLEFFEFNNLTSEGVYDLESYRIDEVPNMIGKYAKWKPGYGIGATAFWKSGPWQEPKPNWSGIWADTDMSGFQYNINFSQIYTKDNPFKAIEHLIKDPVFDGNRISAEDLLLIEVNPEAPFWDSSRLRPLQSEADREEVKATRYYNKIQYMVDALFDIRGWDEKTPIFHKYKYKGYELTDRDVYQSNGIITFGDLGETITISKYKEDFLYSVKETTHKFIIKFSDQNTGYLVNEDGYFQYCLYHSEDNTYELNPTGTSLIVDDIYLEQHNLWFPIYTINSDSFFTYNQGSSKACHKYLYESSILNNLGQWKDPYSDYRLGIDAFAFISKDYNTHNANWLDLTQDSSGNYKYYWEEKNVETNWSNAFEILNSPDEPTITLPLKYAPNDKTTHKYCRGYYRHNWVEESVYYDENPYPLIYCNWDNDNRTSTGLLELGRNGFIIRDKVYNLNPNYNFNELLDDNLNFVRVVESYGNQILNRKWSTNIPDGNNIDGCSNYYLYERRFADSLPLKWVYPLESITFTLNKKITEEEKEYIKSLRTTQEKYNYIKNILDNYCKCIKLFDDYNIDITITGNTITKIYIWTNQWYTLECNGKNFVCYPRYPGIDGEKGFTAIYSNILFHNKEDFIFKYHKQASSTIDNINIEMKHIPGGVLFPNWNGFGLYKDKFYDSYYKNPSKSNIQAIYTNTPIDGDNYQNIETTGLGDETYYDKNIFKFKYGDREWANTLPEEDLIGYDYISMLQDNPIRKFYVREDNAGLLFDNYPVPIGLNTNKPWYKVNTLAHGNGLIYSNPEAAKTPLFTTKYGNANGNQQLSTNGVIGTIINYDWKAHNYVYIENNTPKYISPTFSFPWSEWIKRCIPTDILTGGNYYPAQRILTENIPYGQLEGKSCWYVDNRGCIVIQTDNFFDENIPYDYEYDHGQSVWPPLEFRHYRVGYISKKTLRPVWLIWNTNAKRADYWEVPSKLSYNCYVWGVMGFDDTVRDIPKGTRLDVRVMIEDYNQPFPCLRSNEEYWLGGEKINYKASEGPITNPPEITGFTYSDKEWEYEKIDSTLALLNNEVNIPYSSKYYSPIQAWNTGNIGNSVYIYPIGFRVVDESYYPITLQYCSAERIDFNEYKHNIYDVVESSEIIINEDPNYIPPTEPGYSIEEKGLLYEPPGAFTLEGDMIIGNVSYDKVINNSQTLDFKTIASASISVQINAPVEETNKLIGSNFVYAVDYGDGKWHYMGLFNIEDAVLDDSYTSTITGHDLLNRLNVYIDDFIDNTSYPITLKELYYSLLSYCNISYKEQNFINEGLILQDNFKAVKTTATQILQYITELAGGYIHIGPDMLAHLDYYKNNALTVRPENYSKVSYTGYKAGRINQIKLAYNDKDTVITTTPEDSPNIYYILDNALIVYSISEEEGLRVINNILGYVANLPEYKPATLEMFMAPYNVDIQPGDIIAVRTPDNEVFNMYVMDIHIDSSGITYSSYGEKEVPVDGSQFNSQIIYLKDLRQEIDDIKNTVITDEESTTDTALIRTIRANKVRSQANAEAISNLSDKVDENAQKVEDYNLGYQKRFGDIEEAVGDNADSITTISNTIGKYKVSTANKLATITLDKTITDIATKDYVDGAVKDMPVVGVNSNMFSIVAGENSFGIDPIAKRMYVKLGANTYYFTIEEEGAGSGS